MATAAISDTRDELGAIHRAADVLADLLDNFHPAGALQRCDLNSARNYVAAVTAALDRLDMSTRKGCA